MMKKAIGLLSALALAVSGSLSAFADSSVITESEDYSASQEGEYADEYADDADISEVQQETEEFAIENEDPQLGKYLDSLEQPQKSFSDMDKESGGGADSARTVYGYTNNSLIHNSRFDNMDKVWGIDVSYFQYDIDWNKVKADGIDYAIIRVGYRGYGTGGQLVLDYKFDENMKGAIAAGLEVGVYFYTQAINTTEAVAEADFVLKYIKNYDLDLPVYFDIESVDYDVGRLDSANLTKAQKTALCTAFCDRIQAKGYKAGVYANKSWLTYQIDGEALGKKYPIWLAHYTNSTDYTGVYNTWQFTGSGKVSGINTAVDIDVDYRNSDSVGDITNFRVTASGNKATFNWDPASNAARYEFCRYNPSTHAYTRLLNVTSTQASISISDGNYGYCVRAVRIKDGKTIYGKYSPILYVSRNKVTNITANTSGNSISLNWSAVSGASGYEIYSKNSASSSEYKYYVTVTNNAFNVSGLKPGTYYSYKVRPYFMNGSVKTYGEFSDAVEAVIKPEKLSVPKFESSAKNSIKVSWNKLDYAEGYQIAFYDSATKQYVVKSTLSSKTNSWTISGLSSGSSYRVAVRAYMSVNGKRYYGDYSSYKTCVTLPETVNVLSNYSCTANAIRINWQKVPGATGYRVYRYNTATKKWENRGTIKDADKTTFRDSNALLPGTTYQYKVKAYLKVNNVNYWGLASSVKYASTKPSAINLNAFGATKNAIRINWTPVTCDGYQIYQKQPDGSYKLIAVINDSKTSTYRVGGLSAGTKYTFRVRAFSTDNSGKTVYTDYTAKAKTTASV